jgi:hypothetical protein
MTKGMKRNYYLNFNEFNYVTGKLLFNWVDLNCSVGQFELYIQAGYISIFGNNQVHSNHFKSLSKSMNFILENYFKENIFEIEFLSLKSINELDPDWLKNNQVFFYKNDLEPYKILKLKFIYKDLDIYKNEFFVGDITFFVNTYSYSFTISTVINEINPSDNF